MAGEIVERSAWRASDSVAYEQMRAAADAVVSLLLDDAVPDVTVAASVLDDAQSVDGFNRAAVDAARESFETQLSQLRAARHV